MQPSSNASQNGDSIRWAPILGRWNFAGNAQEFLGEGNEATAHGRSFAVGIAVTNVSMANGMCRVHIRFAENVQAGGIVLGYRSQEQRYVFVELGASNSAYSIGEYVSGFGWRPLVTSGQVANLQPDREYVLQVNISGQNLRLLVDSVPVLEHLLSSPLEGRQIGLIAAGNQKVGFSGFEARVERPKAFVVMQFAEPYGTFYREVIQQRAKAAGFDVVRIDEKAGPGVIFQDIQREIEDSDVVIAEVTPANANVFYELGYAHALKKPTILLAQRGAELPFDIRSFRVVFYNDTIGGKAEVERNLQNHLDAIRGNQPFRLAS